MPNELTSEARPSLRYLFKKENRLMENIYKIIFFLHLNLIAIGTHCMFGFLDVNGLAMEASAFDKDMSA